MKGVPRKDHGGALGALGSFYSLAQFFGALVMENVFAYFISSKSPVHFAGAHFIVGSTFLYSAGVACLFLFNSKKYKGVGDDKKNESGVDETTPLVLRADLSQTIIVVQ